jgi:hypothetical protein
MEQDHLEEFEASLVGQSCSISKRDNDWIFELKKGESLVVSAPWRIVSGGRISFASEDDGHKFGRASPVDGEGEARSLISEKPISSAKVDRHTADITLHFDPTMRIDVFNDSRGYEAWEANYSVNDHSRRLVALGGGEVALVVEQDRILITQKLS